MIKLFLVFQNLPVNPKNASRESKNPQKKSAPIWLARGFIF
jgi:hypothetical protein